MLYNHDDLNPTVHIQMQIQIWKQVNTIQVDSVVSGTNGLLTSCLWFFDTRREIRFLKVFRNHTPPPTFSTSHGVLDLNSSLPVEILKTQLLDSMAESPTTSSMVKIQLSNDCLHGPMSTFNWRFFKILKFSGPSLPGMTSSTLQSFFLSGVYYDNGDCHILCAWV